MKIYTNRRHYINTLHIEDTNVHLKEDLDYIKDYMSFVDIWNDIFNIHNKEKEDLDFCIEIIERFIRKSDIWELIERIKLLNN